jgi:hypothetical protein
VYVLNKLKYKLISFKKKYEGLLILWRDDLDLKLESVENWKLEVYPFEMYF